MYRSDLPGNTSMHPLPYCLVSRSFNLCSLPRLALSHRPDKLTTNPPTEPRQRFCQRPPVPKAGRRFGAHGYPRPRRAHTADTRGNPNEEDFRVTLVYSLRESSRTVVCSVDVDPVGHIFGRWVLGARLVDELLRLGDADVLQPPSGTRRSNVNASLSHIGRHTAPQHPQDTREAPKRRAVSQHPAVPPTAAAGPDATTLSMLPPQEVRAGKDGGRRESGGE